MLAGGAAEDFGSGRRAVPPRVSFLLPCLLLNTLPMNKKINPLQIIVVLFFRFFPRKIFLPSPFPRNILPGFLFARTKTDDKAPNEIGAR